MVWLLRLQREYECCWSQVLHGFPPADGVLLACAAGVAWLVPRRLERKMLLIDAIRLKSENTKNQMSNPRHSVCQSCINIIINFWKLIFQKWKWKQSKHTSSRCPCWSRSRRRSRSEAGWDWSRSCGLALARPTPEWLRFSAAGGGASSGAQSVADAGPDADVGSGAGSGVRLPHFLEGTWNKIEFNLSKPYEN